MSNNAPSITLFFPAYNDEHTIETVTSKALKILATLTDEYEVLIIDDGSPDRSGLIADKLAQEHPHHVRVIHHEQNLGYGRAIRSGLANAKFEWICFTDGDDQYNVYELPKLFRLISFYELEITFRYRKVYSGWRQLVSATYNTVLRFLFKTQYGY